MDDVHPFAGDAVMIVTGVPRDEVPLFIRRSIAERTLSSLVQELNAGIFSGDPARRQASERALHHIGFL